MKVEAEDARHQNSMKAPPRQPRPKSPSGKGEEGPFEERYMLKLRSSLGSILALTSDSVPHLRPHEPVTVTCILLTLVFLASAPSTP